MWPRWWRGNCMQTEPRIALLGLGKTRQKLDKLRTLNQLLVVARCLARLLLLLRGSCDCFCVKARNSRTRTHSDTHVKTHSDTRRIWVRNYASANMAFFVVVCVCCNDLILPACFNLKKKANRRKKTRSCWLIHKYASLFSQVYSGVWGVTKIVDLILRTRCLQNMSLIY